MWPVKWQLESEVEYLQLYYYPLMCKTTKDVESKTVRIDLGNIFTVFLVTLNFLWHFFPQHCVCVLVCFSQYLTLLHLWLLANMQIDVVASLFSGIDAVKSWLLTTVFLPNPPKVTRTVGQDRCQCQTNVKPWLPVLPVCPCCHFEPLDSVQSLV